MYWFAHRPIVRRRRGQRPLSSPVWFASLMALSVYFGHHLLLGEEGLVRLAELRAQEAKAASRLDGLEATRATLEHEIALLDERALHPDYLEERVRATFGYTRPGELVVMKRDLPR